MGTTDARPALLIPAGIRDAMVAQCVREAPLEACGMLLGHPPRVVEIVELRNAAASERRYYADPQQLIDVQITMRERGLEVAAIYHSHPRWEAVPSRTDLARNGWGDTPHVIVSLLGETPVVRAWRLGADSYEELAWSVMPPGVRVEPGGATG